MAVAAYRIRNGVWTQLGVGDPRRPQSFFPIKDGAGLEIHSGDYLAARCTYDNPGETYVEIGNHLHDEMCNFYLMYAMEDNEDGDNGGDYGQCHSPASEHLVANFPHDADSAGGASVASRAQADGVAIGDGASLSLDGTDSPLTAETEVPSSSILPEPEPRFVDEINLPGLGQVGGLATDSAGRLVVFHRGSRRWAADTFSFSNR